MSFIFLLLSLGLGASIVRLFPVRVRVLEFCAMSVAVGLPLSAWICFLLAWIMGFDWGLPFAGAVMVACLSNFYFIKQRVTFDTQADSTKNRIAAAALALAVVFIVIRLLLLSYQLPANGTWKSNGSVWGDLPLHITYVTQFSHGKNVDMVSPNYMKVPLTYPFVTDFYSAILKRLGAGWDFAMIAPSLLMMLSLLYLLYSFGYRMLGSKSASWLTLIFLVFSGGGTQYLNFFTSHLLPQRSYLFGMTLFLAVAIVLLETYKNKSSSRKYIEPGVLPAGLLTGMMPLVHDHSFFVLVGLLGLSTVGMLIYWRTVPKTWIVTLIIGGVLALPQLLWQFHNAYHAHFTQWILGWTTQNSIPVHGFHFFMFWWSQIGILLLVTLVGWYWLRSYKATPSIWILYVGSICIFIICNLYVFQPSVWDNMKFFEYAFWFQMLIAGYILSIWCKDRLMRWLVAPVFVLLTISGFNTLALVSPGMTYDLITQDQREFGESMDKILPQNAFVLVGDKHNHPITMFSDRKVIMTYAGWFNLYDDRWPQVWKDRTTMLKGGEGAEALLQKYRITHAVFSDEEAGNGVANLDFYQHHFHLLVHKSGWWVFEI